MAADSDDVFPLTDAVPASVNLIQKTRANVPVAVASKPKLQPILAAEQRLARASAQPDRLVAMLAARVPLLEAARPLLSALARTSGNFDEKRLDAFHHSLMHEVSAFQSVCRDARLPFEFILAASYVLCTALDEAISHSLPTKAGESTVQAWAGRLATHFHGDYQGGKNVFRLLGFLFREPQDNLDLLELMVLVLALGFKGIYRNAPNGRRTLGGIQEQLFSRVYLGRGGIPSPRWEAIERLLREDNLANALSVITTDLFS